MPVTFSNICYWAGWTAFWVAAVIIFMFVVIILSNLAEYIGAKTKESIAVAKEATTVQYTNRVIDTNNLKNLIDQIIYSKIEATKRTHIMLKKEINVMNYEKDVKELAEFTKESLLQDAIMNPDNIIVTTDYIYAYISSVATTMVLEAYKETNAIVAELKAAGLE